MGILIGPLQTALFVILTLGALGGIVWFLIDENTRKYFYIPLVLTILFALGFIYSAGNTVVQPNERAIVLNWANGSVEPNVRGEGITGIPLFTGKILRYPGGRAAFVTLTYTPSTSDLLEIKMETALTLNLADADWLTIYRKYNTDWSGYLNNIVAPRTASKVASVIKDHTPTDMTTQRPQIAEQLNTVLKDALKDDGIQVLSVDIRNWDFGNPDASKAYDAMALKNSTIQAELKAAEDQAKVAKTQNDTFGNLGLQSDESKIQYLQIQFMQQLLASGKPFTPVIIIGGGNSTPPIAVAPQVSATGTITTTK